MPDSVTPPAAKVAVTPPALVWVGSKKPALAPVSVTDVIVTLLALRLAKSSRTLST